MSASFYESSGVRVIGCRHVDADEIHNGCPLGGADTALDLASRCLQCPVAEVVRRYVKGEASA